MSVCHGGLGEKIYIGGTLAANPISTAACYYALKLMDEHDAVKKATDYADRLTKAMNDLFATREDLGFFVYNFGPIMHYVTTAFFSRGPYGTRMRSHRSSPASRWRTITRWSPWPTGCAPWPAHACTRACSTTTKH